MEFLVFQLQAPLSSWGDTAVGEYRGSFEHPGESAHRRPDAGLSGSPLTNGSNGSFFQLRPPEIIPDLSGQARSFAAELSWPVPDGPPP